MSARRPRRSADRDSRAYALVALIVIVAVMNVLVAASLPYWSQVVKRDKEAELIFRGLQYAEAIRVFQLRFQRLPNTLDELIEVNPRSIRQLWKDPMTDDGEWEPIRGQAGTGPEGGGRQVAGRHRAGRGASAQEEARGRRGRRRAVGPIIGVRSRSKDEAVREFMGSQQLLQLAVHRRADPDAGRHPGHPAGAAADQRLDRQAVSRGPTAQAGQRPRGAKPRHQAAAGG